MTSTQYRDQVALLAKTDTAKAAEIAEKISDPWFQAQAWSQRSAVRAWEISALAERGYHMQARQVLTEALELAAAVTPVSSRAESLIILFQAAFKISNEDAAMVAETLENSCSSSHWRAVRARRDAARMLEGEMRPREFFW